MSGGACQTSASKPALTTPGQSVKYELSVDGDASIPGTQVLTLCGSHASGRRVLQVERWAMDNAASNGFDADLFEGFTSGGNATDLPFSLQHRRWRQAGEAVQRQQSRANSPNILHFEGDKPTLTLDWRDF